MIQEVGRQTVCAPQAIAPTEWLEGYYALIATTALRFEIRMMMMECLDATGDGVQRGKISRRFLGTDFWSSQLIQRRDTEAEVSSRSNLCAWGYQTFIMRRKRRRITRDRFVGASVGVPRPTVRHAYSA